MICPAFGDQPFWGRLVAERGLGARPIPQGRITAARLAAVIRLVMGERAATLGAHIRAEDGVGNAVAILERSLARHRTLQPA